MHSIINLSIQGKNNISDNLYSDEFTPTGKLEVNFNDVVLSDGNLTLPITKLGNFTKIIGNSRYAKMRVNYGVSGVMEVPISGVIYWNFDSGFSSSITGISVATDSLVPVDISLTLITV